MTITIHENLIWFAFGFCCAFVVRWMVVKTLEQFP